MAETTKILTAEVRAVIDEHVDRFAEMCNERTAENFADAMARSLTLLKEALGVETEMELACLLWGVVLDHATMISLRDDG